MTSATLDEHIAMLNAANLKPGEAEELGQFFALGLEQRDEHGWHRSEVAAQRGPPQSEPRPGPACRAAPTPAQLN